MANAEILSANAVRQLLRYDPATGAFTWEARDETVTKNRAWNARYAGKVAGAVKSSTGYVSIAIFGRGYLAHRLAFLWMNGSFPASDVDHANGNRSDNRWVNLREATRQQNCWNVAAFGTLRKRGVSWHKRDGRFQALIRDNGRNRSLGYFDTADEAEAAYNAEAERLHGEFAHHLR